MTLTHFIKKVLFIEILQGLALTFRHMVAPAITRQYPDEKREPVPGSRGLHALVRNPLTGKEKCESIHVNARPHKNAAAPPMEFLMPMRRPLLLRGVTFANRSNQPGVVTPSPIWLNA